MWARENLIIIITRVIIIITSIIISIIIIILTLFDVGLHKKLDS